MISTTLQELQTQARENAAITYTEMQEKDSIWLDTLIAHVYLTALQEALGKVPAKEDEDGYTFRKQGSAGLTMWNECVEETIQAIQGLISTDV